MPFKLSFRNVFLLATIVWSVIYVWPELNFQDKLAQGDHGRDLYAFDAVYRGQVPYKDFWWVYGPLMPYYYGLFYKIFGVHISSILLGRAVLLVASAAFFYLSCAIIAQPSLAFIGAVWFLQGRQEFVCTYNHLGGTLVSLVIIYTLLCYTHSGSMRYLWLSLLATFVMMLIKINFGVVSLWGILIYLSLTAGLQYYPWREWRQIFYVVALGILPLIVFVVYWSLLNGLPGYVIHQCMPYFGNDQPYHASAMRSVHDYLHGFWYTFLSTPVETSIGLLFHLSALGGFYLLLTGKLAEDVTRNIWLSLGLVGMFYVLFFHEYLASNVFYRSFWSYPFLILLHFIMISTVFKVLHPVSRAFVMVFLWELLVFGCITHIDQIQAQKRPEHFLSMERGQIYVGNEPQWVETVNQTTDWLNTHLTSNDVFFALPYDCLYYYLTGQLTPTRQLIFFDHIKIPQEQEISVIKELEAHHVNYVLMSSRIISMEEDLGIFGVTYCPLLAKYVGDNFTQAYRQGGDLQRNPGWADNHGVFILKRN